jgi:peptidoglycan/xylan/chitin deacetylase (PgdA/CDA1 family)
MAKITLTFDNGPVVGSTEKILDLLRARSLHATFFVIGQRLAEPANRRLAERAKAEGHWIGNHTLTHGKPLGLCDDPAHTVNEIAATQAMLGDLAEAERYFRPVGGGRLGPHLLDQAALEYLVENSYTLVTWNNVPRDWVEPRRDWVDLALRTMENCDWTLLVVHDHALDGILDTLETFLDRVDAMGVEIVQAFPESCMPIRCGSVHGSLDDLVTRARATAGAPSQQ